MSGICRLIYHSSALPYDFLSGDGLRVEDFSNGVQFDNNVVTLTLSATGNAKSKAGSLEGMLQNAVNFANDPVAANGVVFQMDGIDSNIVSALVVDFELKRIPPNTLQTLDWGFYALSLVLLDDGRAWESGSVRTVTESNVTLGTYWDVPTDLVGVGSLGCRIKSLAIHADTAATINTTHIGIKPKRTGQTGAWAPIIYGADFDSYMLAGDTTQSGATVTDQLQTTFVGGESMLLRAQSVFTAWGTASGAAAPDWRTQQGKYKLGYVYDHSNNSTQIAVRFKLLVGNHYVYDSGVIYPTSGDTNTHLDILPGEINIGYEDYAYDYLAIDTAGAPTITMSYYAERLTGAGDFYLLRLYLIPAEHYVKATFSSLTEARIDTTARHKVIAFSGTGASGFGSSYTIDEQHDWFYPSRGGWMMILPTTTGTFTYDLTLNVLDTHGLHNMVGL